MKIVVYCYITNNIKKSNWPQITYKDNNISYVMFTDDVQPNETHRLGWELRYVPTSTENMLKEDMNKLYKWHPYEHFKNYDYSIYVDSKTKLIMNPNEIIKKFKDKMKYGFITHEYDYYPKAKSLSQFRYNYLDVYKHIDYLIGSKVGNIPNLKKWYSFLQKESYPKNSGVLECCAIISDLHNMTGKYIQDEIYNFYKQANTTRDQIVAPYVLWKNNIPLNEINLLGKYCYKSIYFAHSGVNINNRDYSDIKYQTSEPLQNTKERIIICLTSWRKRISNCIRIIDDIEKSTILPDKIYLNLSLQEFPQKDIPQQLLEQEKKYDNFEINWVEGENTKCVKKIFPILNKLNDNDIIINTDDDIIFPPTLIESRINDYRKYNKPITGATSVKSKGINFHNMFGFDYMKTATACSLYTKKMLKGYKILLEKNIIELYNDDVLYTILILLNGYTFQPCSDFSVWSDKTYKNNQIVFFNDNDAMSKDKDLRQQGGYLNGSKKLLQIVSKRLQTYSGDMSFWNQNVLNKFLNKSNKNTPTPQPVIPKNSKSKLRQIKEDIKNGKLKKVFIDGKYTWKRYE